MSASTAAARGRVFAERLYESTCTVNARSTGRTTAPDTGAVTDTPGAIHYSGPCRVRPGSRLGAATAESGGAEVFTFDYVVSLPFAAVDVVEGDRVTVDSSPDPALVGVVVDVEKVDRGDHISARRLYCSEVA